MEKAAFFCFPRYGFRAERGWLRRFPAAKVNGHPGNAMSEGMLASFSNSTTGIRRTWMGPPPDLPPHLTTKPILTSLHCTRYDGNCRPTEIVARAKRGALIARTSGLSRQGKVGLPNDDGVANANTPSSTSQSLGPNDRHGRFERAPKP